VSETPGIPGPFSLGDPDRLAAILRGADLADVTVRELAVPLRAASFEEWWKRTPALAGPLSKIVGSLHEHAVGEIRTRLLAAVRPYERPRRSSCRVSPW
jgi:hypothetical protein